MKYLIALLCTLTYLASDAATYTTVSDGKWNQASTWAGGLIPSASSWSSDIIVINHRITKVPDLNLSGPTKLTVSTSGILDGGNGNGNLFNITVGEQATFINQGTINNVAALAVNSNATFNFQSGTITADYLTVNGGNSSNNTLATFISNGTLTINNNVTIGGSGKFTMQSGSLNVKGSFTSTGGDTFTTLAGTVTIKESLANTGSSKMTSTATLSAKSFTNSGGGTSFKSYASMTITNDYYNQGQVVTEGAVTVNGSFTNDWGASITMNTNVFNVKQNFTNNGYIDGNGIFAWGGTISQGWGVKIHPVYNSDIIGPSVPPSTPVASYNLGAGMPLPVRMLDFTGVNQGEATVLSWTTVSEENFDHFEVEVAADAKSYHLIGNVASAGNGQQKHTYAFSYNQPTGTFYFRLKSVDLNGEFHYLKTIPDTRELSSQPSFYPNPVTGQQLTIQVGRPFTSSVVRLYDKNGHLLLEKNLLEVESQLNVETLRPDLYYVILTTDTSISKSRIVVQ